jgi:tRNA 2-thiouridine synthesizing protein B
MLHIVNKSPYERNSLASCLAHAQAGSAVLLIEDAVYAATRGSETEEQIRRALQTLPVYQWPRPRGRGMQANVIRASRSSISAASSTWSRSTAPVNPGFERSQTARRRAWH